MVVGTQLPAAHIPPGQAPALLLWVQVPAAQPSSVHGLPSLQLGPPAWTEQLPALQLSAPLHASPSLQAEALLAWAQVFEPQLSLLHGLPSSQLGRPPQPPASMHMP